MFNKIMFVGSLLCIVGGIVPCLEPGAIGAGLVGLFIFGGPFDRMFKPRPREDDSASEREYAETLEHFGLTDPRKKRGRR